MARAIATRLASIEQKIQSSAKKPLSFHRVEFVHWTEDVSLDKTDFRIQSENGVWTLRPFRGDQSSLLYLQGYYELLDVVKHILQRQERDVLSVRELQDLAIPDDYMSVSKMIDDASDPNSKEIGKFNELMHQVDLLIGEAYGLTIEQLKYIELRLQSPPLDVLVPRWPWKTAELRVIQEYESDRFA